MRESVLTLREVQGSDAELQQLAELLATMDDEPVLPLASMRERYAAMRQYPFYRCYLMVDGDDIPLGTFSLLVFPLMVHDGRPEAIVEGVVVAPAARGIGVGKAMMLEAMRLAREAGACKLALSSSVRRVQAHGFYRGLGFRQHGVSFSIGV
ncbi:MULTISPECIES: GNAT family N-acetyltransferase [Cupriavidus]|uniref:GCN5-related N-acetyltransferase n=1 Tax=Cupriavidus pinatubonensis (strain JMP 134 / LMG 1197) TaxID=264198 RepID=Q46TK0_CUPPJ|nr:MULTISPECIES: GNAT family N-acetyltransferase [Cupriavidus]QYY28749.1 GNAT family N-acetyltransferase [Cupriavidus pinatubonensis]TPQ35852.1 N-acetyltransferase [Cupriavidus pinatubonensis]